MANHKIDLSGKSFGSWRVLRESKTRRISGQPEWVCVCVCGNERSVSGANLRNGVSQSCGCVHVSTRQSRQVLAYERDDDLIGVNFGRWTVLRKGGIHPGANRLQMWVCQCECGTVKEVIGDNLRRGLSLSCGCQRVERSNVARITHGLSEHPIYISWQGMRNRCLNAADEDFKHYGGRGISVCDRWLDPILFIEDMMPTWFAGATIERDDVNGNYEPANCRWITQSEQLQNTRRTVWVDTPWGRITLSAAAKRIGISPTALQARLKRKWPPDKLFGPPTR